MAKVLQVNWGRHMKINSVTETGYGVWVIRRAIFRAGKVMSEETAAILFFR